MVPDQINFVAKHPYYKIVNRDRKDIFIIFVKEKVGTKRDTKTEPKQKNAGRATKIRARQKKGDNNNTETPL